MYDWITFGGDGRRCGREVGSGGGGGGGSGGLIGGGLLCADGPVFRHEQGHASETLADGELRGALSFILSGSGVQ